MAMRSSASGINGAVQAAPRQLGGVAESAAAYQQPVSGGGSSAEVDSPGGWSDWATLSATGSRIAQVSGEAGVREDKVASVRAALVSGSFSIPAAAVAAKTVYAMLGSGI